MTLPTPQSLETLGIQSGDAARFRRKNDQRWKFGVVIGIEKDGSISLRDAKGATRSIPQVNIEIKAKGPRGGYIWEPLPTIAQRTEQLSFLPS